MSGHGLKMTFAARQVHKERILPRITNINSWIMVCMIVNVYALPLENATGVSSFYFSSVPLIIALFIAAKKKMDTRRNAIIFFTLFIQLSFNVIGIIFYGLSMSALKQIIYVISFAYLYHRLDDDSWNYIKKVVYFISFLLIIDALIHLPLVLRNQMNVYNIRNFLLVDKPGYSFFVTISELLSIIEIIYHKKRRLVNFTYIVISSIILILIIQSKVAILALIFGVIAIVYSSSSKIRKKIYIAITAIMILSILLFLVGNVEAPKYLLAMINYITNRGTSVTDSYYNTTFVSRNLIYSYIFELIKKHPILGIGFGNYSFYAMREIAGYATEAESGILNLFVEGGFIYGAIFVIQYAYVVIKEYRFRKKGNRQLCIEIVSTALAMFILNMFNDYISIFFYIIYSGITFETISRKKEIL